MSNIVVTSNRTGQPPRRVSDLWYAGAHAAWGRGEDRAVASWRENPDRAGAGQTVRAELTPGRTQRICDRCDCGTRICRIGEVAYTPRDAGMHS
ncbi:hypothetical protein AZOA_44170 [Azoarcus sp. Aa7]|nr:hypothetical protein [Azoarcus sp. Aa7]